MNSSLSCAAWIGEVDAAEVRRRSTDLAAAAASLQRFAGVGSQGRVFRRRRAAAAGRELSATYLIALADRAMYQVKHGAKRGVALLEE